MPAFAWGRTYLLLLFVGLPHQAWCWAASGHSIVAEIAQRQLSKGAAEQIEALIGHASLASLASWADDYKFTPAGTKTKQWHFADIDLAAPGFSAAKDCAPSPGGDCIVAALAREIRILADRDASPLDRQVALRFVVHLVGDLSQPFHCAEHDKDQGGNKVPVTFTGKDVDGKPMSLATNLHAVWDETLIAAHAYSWGAYLDELEATTIPAQPEMHFDDKALVAWVNDCHDAAKTAYGQLPAGWEASATSGQPVVLDAAYQTRAQPLLDQQLARGGLELAAVLNAALAQAPSAP